MEAKVIIPLWGVIVSLILFAGSFAVIAYMTRRNTQEIKDIRDNYVSSELYHNEVKHINSNLDEIKGQNTQILAMLASKSSQGN